MCFCALIVVFKNLPDLNIIFSSDLQEIHEEGGGDVGIHADPDYVPEEEEEGEVMTDDDNAPGLATT